MFALHYTQFGGPEVLSVGEVDTPHADSGQIRIRVRACGVTPVDARLRSGGLVPQLPWPHVPGADAAGVVDEIGAGVTDVHIGAEVFGAFDVSRLGGAAAEFAVLQFWARRPPALSWEQAAALGTSAETATRALDLLQVQAGTTLLVDGAAGGVDNIAVQLALSRGAQVIGTASRANRGFLQDLGAQAITYGPDLAARILEVSPDGVDAALDVAGAGSLPDLVAITGDAGRVVSISDLAAAQYGVHLTHVGSGDPDGRAGLAVAAALAEQGRLVVPIRAALPLTDAAAAHDMVATGHGRGKVVLRVSAD